MIDDLEKIAILQSNNYVRLFDESIYYNTYTKKVFSEEAIQDHDLLWMKEKLDEKNEDTVFYINGSIDNNTVKVITKLMDNK
jgi:hypothetical protein